MGRMRRIFQRTRAEKSLDKELQFHLERQIAEYGVSAHSLASLTFFTSDEFFPLKLQKKRVFQQAANTTVSQKSTRPILVGQDFISG
jgi:hypothetical protein